MSEREIAEKVIKDFKVLVSEAEQKLAELDKPELRHGWYGVNKYGDFRFVIEKEKDGLAIGGSDCLGLCSEALADLQKEGIEFGNFVDDFKRNSKDLEEFEVNDIKVKLDADGDILLSEDGDTIIIEKHGREEFHQNLGQLLAYAKRKQMQEKQG